MTPELEEALVNKRLNRNLLRLLLIDTLAEKEVAFKDALMEKEVALKEKEIVIKEKEVAIKEKEVSLKDKDIVINGIR